MNVGTRDIRRLGGLMSLMPVTFTIALIGSFSMAGLPPFNGFLSKEMFFESVLNVRNLESVCDGDLGNSYSRSSLGLRVYLRLFIA